MLYLNSFRHLSLFLVSFSVYFLSSEGNIRFVCPRPQSPNSSLTSGPCGGGKSIPFENDYTEVWPGLLTVKLEETVILSGAPLKISLLNSDYSRTCVLLDHIPHNNASRVIGNCEINKYPLGGCTSPTYLTVRIPDFKCDKCVLQVVQIVPKEGETCKHTRDFSNCTTYYSCANIRIRSTLLKSISSCSSQLRYTKDYPFQKTNIYWGKMDGPFTGGLIYFSDYPMASDLSYDITFPKTTQNIGGMSLYTAKTQGNPFFTRFKRHGAFKYVGNVGSRWEFVRYVQSVGEVWLRITYRTANSYRSAAYKIVFKETLNARYIYKRSSSSYDSTGMMSPHKVPGKYAVFSEIAYPAGKCTPATTTYGAVLYKTDRKDPRGVAIYKWTAQKLHLVSMLFDDYYNDIWNVSLSRKSTRGSKLDVIKIPSRQTKGSTIETSVPAGNIYNPPTNIFYNNSDSQCEGRFALSTKAVIRSESGVLVALAIIIPLRMNLLRIVMMIHHYVYDERVWLTINGPGTISTEGPAILDLTPARKRLSGRKGISDNLYPVKDSAIPLYMWSGDLYVNYLNVRTGHVSRGQFEPANKEMCDSVQHVLCQTCVLSRKATRDKDLVYQTEYATGRATFHYNEPKNTLDITVMVESLHMTERISKAYLRSPGITDIPINTQLFKKVSYSDKTVMAQISIVRDRRIDSRLMSGLMLLRIETTRKHGGRHVTEYFKCEIPAISRPPTFPPSTASTTTMRYRDTTRTRKTYTTNGWYRYTTRTRNTYTTNGWYRDTTKSYYTPRRPVTNTYTKQTMAPSTEFAYHSTESNYVQMGKCGECRADYGSFCCGSKCCYIYELWWFWGLLMAVCVVAVVITAVCCVWHRRTLMRLKGMETGQRSIQNTMENLIRTAVTDAAHKNDPYAANGVQAQINENTQEGLDLRNIYPDIPLH